ncbi:hypothetical protein VE02_10150 [Pseudogymnoascus sp. 03VT05]|nr:hypothetical protein VE02_10150 [Pseudogymnoascus sp. 03VT05]
MGAESRVITRSRPSLNCLPCKRRKIKCGKQRPACFHCKRLNESCVYELFPPQTTNYQRNQKRRRTSPENAQDGIAEATNIPFPALHAQHLPHLSKFNQADLSMIVQQPRHEIEWAKDTTTEASFLIEDQDLSFLLNDHDDIFAATSSMDFDPHSISSYDTHSSVPSQSHVPFGCASFTTHLPKHSDEPLARDLQVGHAIEFSQKRANGAKVINKWALDDPLDNTAELLRALKQMPENGESSGLPWCLSTGQGPLHRYVGSSFWELSGTGIPDCDRLLQAQQARLYSKEFDDDSWAGFKSLLRSLPSKKLCDVLIQSFLLGVRPLLPLVHGPTLQAEYDSFWVRYNNDELQTRPNNYLADASFLCLLWSVLYCGAVAASPSLLAKASIHIRHTPALLLRLRTKLDESLSLCKFTKLPTLNGLIASILARECDSEVDEILTAPVFVTQSMLAAKSLGLHSEEVIIMAYGEVEGEIARRVWYHIIYLEVLATLTSGSSLSQSSNEELYTTKIPREFDDINLGLGRANQDGSTQNAHSSSAMLLSIGRYEMTRVMRKVVEQCYSNRIPSKEDMRNLIAELEQFQGKIDVLIGRLKVRGLPEHGHISTQLLKADPLIHKRLYNDNPHDETVFNAFARIVLCSWMFGYNNGVIGGAIILPSFHAAFSLPAPATPEYATITSTIVSLLQLGALVGSLLIFPLVRLSGRLPSLALGSVLFAFGSLLQVFSSGHLPYMYAGRFIGGIGLGCITVVVPMYISELSPPAIRGSLVGLYEINNQLSSLCGFFANYFVGVGVDPGTDRQWQIPLAMQVIPAGLLLLAVIFILPESPLFLIQRGKIGKARIILSSIRGLPAEHRYITEEIELVQSSLPQKPSAGQSRSINTILPLHLFRELLWHGNINRLIIGCLLMVGANTSGINGVNFYSPSIFRRIGFTSVNFLLLLSGFFAIAKTTGTFVGLFFFIDRFGRKFLLVISSTGIVLAFVYIGSFLTVTRGSPTPGSIAGYFAMAAVYFYAVSFSLAWNGVPWVYSSEIYQPRLKELSMSITTAVQWIMQYAIARLTPVLLSSGTHDSGNVFFFLFAACTLLAAALVAKFLPETKGLTAKGMDEIFGSRYANREGDMGQSGDMQGTANGGMIMRFNSSV